MNIVAFVPLGMLLCGAIKELRWRHELLEGGFVFGFIFAAVAKMNQKQLMELLGLQH